MRNSVYQFVNTTFHNGIGIAQGSWNTFLRFSDVAKMLWNVPLRARVWGLQFQRIWRTAWAAG